MTTALEVHLRPALEGDRHAARLFLEILLEAQLFVPERTQLHKMSDTPEYPNDFFNLLAVQDKDRVIVPVFARKELIAEWCGNELSTRTMKGRDILKLMPPEWWICVNPAAEIEKELSPWEIEQLLSGEPGIAAILDELYQHQIVEPLEVSQVNENECPLLMREMRGMAKQHPEIQRIFLVRQKGKDLEENIISQLLLGIELDATSANGEDLRSECQSLADRCQVGSDKVSVFVAPQDSGDMSLGLFSKASPFFEKKTPSFLGRLLGRS